MSAHWYSKAGELMPEGAGYPSVTTILGVRANPGLQEWRDRMGAQMADAYGMERATIGTAVHEFCEHTLKDPDRPLIVTADLAGYVFGFSMWMAKFDPKHKRSEQFIYSDLHEYAGTADLICTIDGEQWLIDFKTSKHIRPEYALQLAAYAQAWQEMGHGPSRRAVLQLTPDIKRGYRWKEFTDDDDFGVFMAHKAILDWQLKVEPIKTAKEQPQWQLPSLI